MIAICGMAVLLWLKYSPYFGKAVGTDKERSGIVVLAVYWGGGRGGVGGMTRVAV